MEEEEGSKVGPIGSKDMVFSKRGRLKREEVVEAEEEVEEAAEQPLTTAWRSQSASITVMRQALRDVSGERQKKALTFFERERERGDKVE